MKIKFIKQTSEKKFTNGFTGKGNSKRYICVDENGFVGCLPNENVAYSPIGGISTLKEVLDILEFKNLK
jgi:hypothetical protein